MPRPILGGGDGTSRSKISGQARTESPRNAVLQESQLQHRLRLTRSRHYVGQMKRLDAGTHHADRAALESLLEAIAAEFPDLTFDQRPLGLVSKCFLGEPYEVHTFDLKGEIIQHFTGGQPMDAFFERARSLALHPRYAFIEVYYDSLRAVADDGSVSIIQY